MDFLLRQVERARAALRNGWQRRIILARGRCPRRQPYSFEPAPDVLGRVQNEAKRRGLIVGRGELHANVIRLCPPLIVSERDVDDAVDVLDVSFAAASTP